MFFTFVTVLTIGSCYSARLPRDKDLTDLQTQKSETPSNSVDLKQNLTFQRIETTYEPGMPFTNARQPKKWQVGRVTRKQYEIINLLWRKTKFFVNVENTTPKLKLDNITKKVFDLIKRIPITFPTRPPNSQSFLTPSYIEFYYSDETDDHLEQKDCVKNTQSKKDQKFNTNVISSPNSSFLVFHIKGPLLTRTTAKKKYSPFNHIPHFFSEFTSKPISPYKTVDDETKTHVVSQELRTEKRVATKSILSSCKTCKTESTAPIFFSDFTASKSKYSDRTESTTVYDKIKFFEMYDKHTRVPIAKKANMLEFEYSENTDEEIKINDVHKILLEHVDQSSHEHNESKHSKKHILENDKNKSESSLHIIEGNVKPTANTLSISTERRKKTPLLVTNRTLVKLDSTEYKNVYSYINKSVSWSDYPFAAVYINEPSQVHCEAASISAHWLVASGSCLSRLTQSPLLGEGRSAFVAYCGESWWQPERVSYVKYTVVHPWYHPRDPTRRHLYNIGVIQVVTSMMSACNDWAPVSLMSHQFAASKGGSEALALGWGLDRYDTRYASADLPKASLMIYKGLVFSNSCPGNIGYGKVKQFDEEGGVKNVFCLSLPPYSGEERDPIHGSLLLVGGKLIALYLQEERHPWGEQSAQYTGIWRLIPWVVEVAREPEEMEWKI